MRDEFLASTLADVALAAAERSSTPTVAAATSRTLLDWFAVTVGGTESPATLPFIAGLSSAAGDVRLAGAGGRYASVETAALIHGTAAHALELDDIYAPGLYHPGAPTVAAALAVAERYDATGADVMRGVVAGVEVGCRVAAALGAQHYRHWHTTGTVGAIGAAVAASVVMGSTREQVAHSIAIAGTMAGGLQQTFRRDGAAKPLHSGHAAQSGVIAAISAAQGLTGALDILEGESGLAAATGTTADWSGCRVPNDGALCIEDLTVKPYPCCGHTFAAIDAALELRQRGIGVEDLESLTVETYSAAIATAGIPTPAKASEARFSIPYAVAVALLDGRVTSGSFAEDRVSDPAVAGLLARTTLRPHGDFDAVFPLRRGARLIAQTRAGDSVVIDVPDRLGSPQNPISDSALRAKFDDLVAPVLGVEASGILRQAVEGLDGLTTVRDLPWVAAS